jgi:hypothetical protein
MFLETAASHQGGELEFPDRPHPGAAVHRPRPGRAAARHHGQRGQHRAQPDGSVTGVAEAGYIVKRKESRSNTTPA